MLRTKTHAGLVVWLALIATRPIAVLAAGMDIEQEPINYSSAPPDNMVSALQEAIESGDVTLENHKQFGWLPALLRELDVPVSSQTLVFSKTSLQRQRISPRRPRALYFNDDVYVGWVQEGALELTAVDPTGGPFFYTLPQLDEGRPKFERHTSSCGGDHQVGSAVSQLQGGR